MPRSHTVRHSGMLRGNSYGDSLQYLLQLSQDQFKLSVLQTEWVNQEPSVEYRHIIYTDCRLTFLKSRDDLNCGHASHRRVYIHAYDRDGTSSMLLKNRAFQTFDLIDSVVQG